MSSGDIEVRIVSREPIKNRRGDAIGEEIMDEHCRLWYRYREGIAHTMTNTILGHVTNGTILVPNNHAVLDLEADEDMKTAPGH